MDASSLKRLIFTPILLSTAVFSVMTLLPIGVDASKPVTIQVDEEPVFYGPLKELAFPYLSLAAVLSIGTGVTSLAILGWQLSSRQSSEVESQLSNLEQKLNEKEAQVDALKLSETRLKASGLNMFLDDEEANELTLTTSTTSFSTQPVVELLASAEQWVEPQLSVSFQRIAQATERFACSQTFLGYTQAKNDCRFGQSLPKWRVETSPPPITQVDGKPADLWSCKIAA